MLFLDTCIIEASNSTNDSKKTTKLKENCKNFNENQSSYIIANLSNYVDCFNVPPSGYFHRDV